MLGEALADGLKSTVLRSLIVWIANDLADSLLLDDSIHPDSNLGDFLIELNRLLKEIYCPYASMTAGPSDERFSSAEQLISLLNYMLSEQMAARMADRKRMKTIDESKVRPSPAPDGGVQLTTTIFCAFQAAKSPPTASLRRISRSLNVPVPQSASVKTLFETIFSKLNASMKSKSFGKPLFVPSKALTSEKWVQLEKSRQELDREYDLRREMLVTRLDVTVQSFQWADAIKLKENAIAERYRTKRSELNALKRGGHSTDISELLAARDDLLFVEKTSSGTVQQNTKCNIQKHMIGAVPDRGGRTSELAPPPPEMPSWQKNRATGPSGGHRVKRDNESIRRWVSHVYVSLSGRTKPGISPEPAAAAAKKSA